MVRILPVDVFTPTTMPTYTYVQREGDDIERRLKQALSTPNSVVSISGPSKSGKTVVVERIIGSDCVIPISGSEIRAVDDLWERVLDWMEVPATTSAQTSTVKSNAGTVEVGAKGGLPLFAEVGGKTTYQAGGQQGALSTTSTQRGGLAQVQREIASSDFVIFFDDFHYMSRELQAEVAKQIKAGAERGIRFCTASVPHRSGDVVRANPELRGRTTNVDTTFWSKEELEGIGRLGFAALNVEIAPDVIDRFAREACGSPQLMQAICLNACFRLGIEKDSKERKSIPVSDQDVRLVLAATASNADYGALVTKCHQGPRTRGQERKVFELFDGSEGDVYRVVLLAIALDPPAMELPYAELMARVAKVCTSEKPPSARVQTH